MSFRVNEIEQIIAKYVETQGSVAVVAWDEGNTVVYCNKAFSGLMQSEAELCGKTVFQFLRFPEYPGFDFEALDGSLNGVEFRRDPNFGFEVPVALAGVDAKLLNPRETWADKAAYDAQARKLVEMFSMNFGQYVPHIDEDVKAAAIG